MYGFGICLAITYLAEDGFSGAEVNEREPNCRRDSSALADGANKILIPGSRNGRSCSCWATSSRLCHIAAAGGWPGQRHILSICASGVRIRRQRSG